MYVFINFKAEHTSKKLCRGFDRKPFEKTKRLKLQEMR